MGVHSEYSCSECGFKLEDSSNIFWIDWDKNVHVDILTVKASSEASKSLVSGGIYKYYCYDCGEVIYNFHITSKEEGIGNEEIIFLLEKLDDNVKIIDFDNRFQNCINCGKSLDLKLEKSFALDSEGNFCIEDSKFNFSDKPLDLSGKYYGYYCRDCSKQINKFVIFENNADLDESLIKEILEDHTNELTVFIDDTYAICPLCAGELSVLGESSKCPSCAKGELKLVNRTFID
ncbi:hypothetical protein [uncultured Methanobrevibacter sp.]|uniref:hypothetical protein n=1 Tax=uncultured Methanobrevibacter sp. TaxID=253161 RepID=UPI0025ECADED|nr:hypothetical protein [uncultured Methanobrevibacter sp.]